jgi:3,4-dihydroxy 2-butanone 4-phosphate synthase / GTP cyclohydrolase II
MLSQLRPSLHPAPGFRLEYLEDSEMRCPQFIGQVLQRGIGALISKGPLGDRGVFFSPCEDISPRHVNSLLSISTGVLLAALSDSRVQECGLTPLPATSSIMRWGIPYASVEARDGITTGISSHDRAITLSILGGRDGSSSKLLSPGHITPFSPRSSSYLTHYGFIEAMMDLLTQAGLSQASVFVEALDKDGRYFPSEVLRLRALEEGIPVLDMEDAIGSRCRHFSPVRRIVETGLPTNFSDAFVAIGFEALDLPGDHLVLMKGGLSSPLKETSAPPFIWIHRENIRDDAFGTSPTSHFHSSRHLLSQALHRLGTEPSGAILFLRDGRLNDVMGEELYDVSAFTLPYDTLAYLILRDLGLDTVRLGVAHKGEGSRLKPFSLDIVEEIIL